ncbi:MULTISPECIES: hypothetical protein [Enterobacterales]|uniref:hypothetical protein n=1 Tax=Enterobacterales TaxID=91347 RepID=UPI002ED8CA93
MAGENCTQNNPEKVVLPHVKYYSAEMEAALDPFVLALYHERCEMMLSFKQALDAAGVEYVEYAGACHE